MHPSVHPSPAAGSPWSSGAVHNIGSIALAFQGLLLRVFEGCCPQIQQISSLYPGTWIGILRLGPPDDPTMHAQQVDGRCLALHYLGATGVNFSECSAPQCSPTIKKLLLAKSCCWQHAHLRRGSTVLAGNIAGTYTYQHAEDPSPLWAAAHTDRTVSGEQGCISRMSQGPIANP